MKFSAYAAFTLITASTQTTAFTNKPIKPNFLSTLKATTTSPPERVAPNAGYNPEWEDRANPQTNDFLKSDLNKPDLTEELWECPLTLWNSNDIDINQVRKEVKNVPHCPLELRASAKDNEQEVQYFLNNKEKIRNDLVKHGAIWLRGFDLMKTVPGYRTMYESLGLLPCLDPLHSSGLRKFASERDALYEEVNKPSLRGHYIGLHSESTAKRTAAYAGFVCFQRATEGGGRFLVADGAKILEEMDPKVLQKLCDRKIRISVSNLDIPPALPAFMKEGIKNLVDTAVAPKFDMNLEMMYEADGKPGRLQAVEEAETPVNRHPVTGLPIFFNNAHNHARKLRDRRPCGVPEVGMTEVFYADTMDPLTLEDCSEIKRASEKHITSLPMEPGDVLLVDNYRALHGRDVFQGDRFHAVSWFTWDGNDEWRGTEKRIVDKDPLNKMINQMMDFLPKDFQSDQT